MVFPPIQMPTQDRPHINRAASNGQKRGARHNYWHNGFASMLHIRGLLFQQGMGAIPTSGTSVVLEPVIVIGHWSLHRDQTASVDGEVLTSQIRNAPLRAPDTNTPMRSAFPGSSKEKKMSDVTPQETTLVQIHQPAL